MTGVPKFHKDAVKAAKKAMKKSDNDSIKMKKLTKKIIKKIGSKHPEVDEGTINKWLSSQQDFFHVKDGKTVSLVEKKKRKPEEAEEVSAKKTKTTDSTISPSSIEDWRKEHKIVIKDTLDDEDGIKESKRLNQMKEYYPYSTFDSEGCQKHIPKPLLRQCTDANGFLTPSAIQAQCWPVMLETVDEKKRDAVGIAETGSGKTLAFALPALTRMYKEDEASNSAQKKKSPRMLVVAPTRELAIQSHDVLKEFGAVVNLRSLVVYGGVPKYEQVSALKRGNIDIVVATPGRLKDLLEGGSIHLGEVKYLVLDEADRMLDDGFRQEIIYIISQCKSREDGRQTAMFSATWPAAIQKIALDFMYKPIRIYVGFEAIVGSNGENGMDDSLCANKRVTQVVEVIDDRAREARLRKLLQKHHSSRENRILIFALYKKEAERLEYSLRGDGWSCCSIHGNKQQIARQTALASFKDGSCPLMIATDVAARGLDIPNVEMVINFTFPLTIEDYVHRIGRTGRAGKKGLSHTFFQPDNKSHAGELQQVMRQAGQDVPAELLKFGSTIKKKEHKLYGSFGPAKDSGPMKKATRIVFD
mmetsp:Transcript_14113/g.20847  ORF Transcript_14113/g.20847 Transcript_14113/m.20847 type:complete len:586 (+) Transcript_14113:66-1823(+)